MRGVHRKDGAAGAPAAQNIYRRGNTPQRSTLIGCAAIGATAVVVLAYLFLVDAPARRDRVVDRFATQEAQRQAQVLNRAVVQLFNRLGAAADAPEVRASLVQDDPQVRAGTEVRLRRAFPEAEGLRLLTLTDLGTADIRARTDTLRNHIEIDLVRRVSNGEPDQVEAYEIDGAWLISLARLVRTEESDPRRGGLLLTLPADSIRALLPASGDSAGQYTLRQRIFSEGQRSDDAITSVGEGLTEHRSEAPVAGTPWHLVFAPSRATVNAVAEAAGPAWPAFLLLACVAIAGMLLTHLSAHRAVARDVQRITEGAELRTPLGVSVPGLLPLARALRRATHRSTRSSLQTQTGGARSSATLTALTGIEGPAAVELPATIFRAYDIRGIAESELTDETVFRIGCAIATLAGEAGEQTLALAYDGRSSSARLRDILENALLRCGRDVVDIGLVPTPLLYYATHATDLKSGIMITGSHSPADYNGLKVVLKGQPLAEGAIDRVRTLAQNGRFSRGTGRKGQQSVVSDYLDEVVGDIALAVPPKIVVDAGNGATSSIAPDLLRELGCEVIPLNCEIDGTFPNRSPDTGDESALEGLVSAVLATRADFGVAFDGDGDRVAVVTDKGRILRTDTLLMLFARDLVARHPGADVVFDVKCSRNLGRLVSNLGGRPVLWKTGHALMKQKMLETGALLGGEFSGHIFFGERWYGFDDGMYVTGRLAELLSAAGQALDSFVSDLPTSFNTPEILVPVPEEKKFDLVERFIAEAAFPGATRNTLDGLRVDFEDGWGLLRASNTGPALTARFEGVSEQSLQRIQNEFHEQLHAVAPDLNIPF